MEPHQRQQRFLYGDSFHQPGNKLRHQLLNTSNSHRCSTVASVALKAIILLIELDILTVPDAELVAKIQANFLIRCKQQISIPHQLHVELIPGIDLIINFSNFCYESY